MYMLQQSTTTSYILREIQDTDNAALADIIKTSLTELGLNKPGTVFGDPETNFVSLEFKKPKTKYWVIEIDGKLIAGAGINSLKGVETSVCELQKMYVQQAYRSKGIAQVLMSKCLEFAKAEGYQKVYLETMEAMNKAKALYVRNGFTSIKERLGSTGHFDCKVFMVKDL